MFVENHRVIVGPLAILNEMLKDGGDGGIRELAAEWADVKTRAANDDWQFDMSAFDEDELAHIKEHWLGIGGESWFPGIDTAERLEKGFAHAMSIAGSKPVSAIWVPAPGLEDVTVSVVDNPTSVIVVLTSPVPDGAATAGGDDNVTEFPPRESSG